MRIALTGASGFIGRALALNLAQAGYDVIALKHRRDPPEHDNISVVQDDLGAFLQGADVLIHCAGAVAAPSQAAFLKANCEVTRDLAQMALQYNVSRVLLFSSLAAREPALSPYAASKKAGEDALRQVEGVNWDVIRPPAVYGAGDTSMLEFLKLAKIGLGVMPAGAKARVSTIHVDDLVGAVRAWVDVGEVHQRIYEIAGPERDGQSWGEVIDVLSECFNKKLRRVTPPRALLVLKAICHEVAGKITRKPVFFTRGKLSEILHQDWVCHDRSFEDVTGWRAQTNFKQGIERTIEWYKAQGYL